MEKTVRDPKTERVELRVTRRFKKRITEVARLRGTSISDFILSSADEAASRILDREHTIRLSRKAAEEFVKLLLDPPPPNGNLIRAMQRHREWERGRS